MMVMCAWYKNKRKTCDMKKLLVFGLICLFPLTAFCTGIHNKFLETPTFDFGPSANYYVHPSKISLVDIQDSMVYFDVVAKIELVNNTSKPVLFDITCEFVKENKIVHTKKIKGYKLYGGLKRLLVLTYSAKDYSVNGYVSRCTIKQLN